MSERTALATSAILFTILPVCPLLAADWPEFLGPARNGTSTEKGLLQSWTTKGPPVVWSKDIGEGFSGPVVVGGRLILFHRVGDNEVVDCLNAADASARWQFTYPCAYHDPYAKGDGPRSTPLVSGGHVFTLGAEGRLHCLELDSGKKLWERSLNTDFQVPDSFFGVGTSPLLEGDHLLINVGARDAGIVALHKDTGKEVWKATDHGASYSSPVAATIAGTRHVFFFTREGLVSVDPANGTVRFSKRWRSRLNASVNAATPVVVEDQVFLSASYGTGAILQRVQKDSVEEIWKSDAALSNHYSTSIFHAGFLFGFDGRQEEGARLRCVDFKTGKVRWTKDGFGCGSMILADGNLIVLSETGALVVIEATEASYREKARATVLGKPCRAQIALANGRLYARDNKKLICLNLKK